MYSTCERWQAGTWLELTSIGWRPTPSFISTNINTSIQPPRKLTNLVHFINRLGLAASARGSLDWHSALYWMFIAADLINSGICYSCYWYDKNHHIVMLDDQLIIFGMSNRTRIQRLCKQETGRVQQGRYRLWSLAIENRTYQPELYLSNVGLSVDEANETPIVIHDRRVIHVYSQSPRSYGGQTGIGEPANRRKYGHSLRHIMKSARPVSIMRQSVKQAKFCS
ncbi:uncharacterized protein EDB93DRAFT_943262 [Suillus bovinus]|uniref:uncharacterized protein n=1 Tax=Suillus bovinus TaxID=48563 RepID=UPI001B882D28|nr:uncharacterized protein EDB93DRAFT_943262 [Suillus bovinus]KAG2131238.1 hypothetical protein EDB93DRAFT_943262 [Suillus bovinus]